MDTRSRRIPPALASLFVQVMLIAAAAPGDGANVVRNVAFDPASPAALQHDTDVGVTFEYETDEPGGARIWFRPFTAGDLSPDYAAHGSPLYTESGSGTGSFRIASGEVLVDEVRVQMWTDGETALLYEEFFPVRFHYAASGEITNIQLAPPSPAAVNDGDNVVVTFDYMTPEQDGVLVFFRPYSGGDLSPDYAAHPSEVYPAGAGVGSGWFTIASGAVVVDEIRVTMTNPAQSTTYHEFRFPVNYTFQSTAVEPTSWGRVKTLYR